MERAIHLPSSEIADLGTFVLEPGWQVTGRVADALTREPIAGASIRHADAGGVETTSADDGTYALDAENLALLEVRAPGYAKADRVVTQSDGNDFLLQRPGRLAVTLWDEHEDRACAGCTLVASMGRHVVSAITDGSGEALLADLPPGDYDVVQESVRATSAYVTVSGGSHTTTATVRPLETTRVAIGRKRDSVEIVFVPPVSDRRQLRASGSEGVEIVDALPSGSYRVKRKNRGANLALVAPASGVVLGSMPENFTGSRIEMRLHPTTTRVRCVRAGQAEAGVTVTLRNVRGEIAAWGTSNSDGEVLLANIPVGTYSVTGEGRPTVTISVTDGATTVVDF